MTDHEVFEEQICALLDGELSAEDEAALRSHLEECGECRAFLSSMEVIAGLAAKDLPEAPPDLAGNVMARVRAEAGASRRRKKVFRFPYRSVAVAAAAAAVLWAGARALPVFRDKGAGSPAAGGAAQTFSASSVTADTAAEEASEPEEATGAMVFGTVNGALFADAGEAGDSLAEADTAREPSAPAAAVPVSVSLRGAEIFLDGKPVTLETLAERLDGGPARTAGAELLCEEADPETEAAVRELLARLEIPVH